MTGVSTPPVVGRISLRYKHVTQHVLMSNFARCVAEIDDPRSVHGRRHSLLSVIGICCCAILAGRTTFTAIHQWAIDAPHPALDALGCRKIGPVCTPPSYNTIRRVIGAVSPLGLAVLAAKIEDCAEALDDFEHWALDGKRLRGSRPGTEKVLLVAAVRAGRQVIGQVRSEAGDEIGTGRALLVDRDLDGVVVTADAHHTQTETATLILEAGGDFALLAKGNQPTLFDQVKALPWGEIDNDRIERETGHGRRETRTVKTIAIGPGAPADFPGAVTAFRIHRYRYHLRKRKTEREYAYGITSLAPEQIRPAELARLIRHHWKIEVLHHIRDVTFGEDAAQIRVGHAPENTASLRNFAICLLSKLGFKTLPEAMNHVAASPYTRTLAMLGLADIEPRYELK